MEVNIIIPIIIASAVPIFSYLFYHLGKVTGHIEYLEKELGKP